MSLLTHNLGWKLVSLVAAFLIWVNIANEPELATILTTPVEYKDRPKDLEISSRIIDSVQVAVNGPSGQLRDLSEQRLAAIIDLSSVRAPGERTFTLTSAELNLPRGIQLIRIIPAQLRFTFEHRLTRSVPVEIPFSGQLPAGLKLTSYSVSPTTLGIAGPESRVAAAAKALSDPFDLTHVTGDTHRKLSVYIGEPQVRFTGVPQVTVSIHVDRSR